MNMISTVQWLADVNQKVMLENGKSVPVILLANKVAIELIYVDQFFICDSFSRMVTPSP